MARRRMFSLDVVETDLFLDLPSSAQALYFHLGMRADDEGFVSSPKRVTAMCGLTADDLNVLVETGLIIPFESGICVIRDWNRNNYIQSDRRTKTAFAQEKKLLEVLDDRSYRILDTSRIQPVSNMDTQIRKEQNSKGQLSTAERMVEEARGADQPYTPLSESDFENRRAERQRLLDSYMKGD